MQDSHGLLYHDQVPVKEHENILGGNPHKHPHRLSVHTNFTRTEASKASLQTLVLTSPPMNSLSKDGVAS